MEHEQLQIQNETVSGVIRETASEAIIAKGVSWDDYMEHYAADFAEWADGDVFTMAPVRFIHNQLSLFLAHLFREYLSRTGGGIVLHSPFVMKLSTSSREPDVSVVLPQNVTRIKETFLDGPADLVVEISSPESDSRDRVVKFSEYEAGGVPEYWIIDPQYAEALFYQRDDKGVFQRAPLDENGTYHSRALDRFVLPVELFWRETLPDAAETSRLVEAMLATT
jgi:Uma2 family endonuclease